MASLSSEASSCAGLFSMANTKLSKFPVSSDFSSWIRSCKTHSYTREPTTIFHINDCSICSPCRRWFCRPPTTARAASRFDCRAARWWRSHRFLRTKHSVTIRTRYVVWLNKCEWISFCSPKPFMAFRNTSTSRRGSAPGQSFMEPR